MKLFKFAVFLVFLIVGIGFGAYSKVNQVDYSLLSKVTPFIVKSIDVIHFPKYSIEFTSILIIIIFIAFLFLISKLLSSLFLIIISFAAGFLLLSYRTIGIVLLVIAAILSLTVYKH